MNPADDARLAASLADLMGAGAVIVDPGERAYCSTDVYAAGAVAALVLRPESRAGLPEAVRRITQAGYHVLVRGGGMSYTGGYTPRSARSVVIDMTGLNRIVDLRAEDRVITVEAGVTWRQIHRALSPLGLRLPFFGTFSGRHATVGGGLSNGALFMGSARHGSAAEIVLGLEVIDGHGRVIHTGQAGFRNGRPGFRNYGPDLTGVFVHDAGTLGVKTEATLRVMEAPACEGFLSFAFAGRDPAIAALSDLARSGAAEEAFLFDPATTARSLEPASLKRDLQRLGRVVRQAPSWLRGLAEGARMAGAGRGFAAAGLYTLHVVCAGRSPGAVDADLDRCRDLAGAHEGAAIADTIPRAARANPFEPLNGILGADGERWAALNAKVPHSDAPRLVAATEALFAAQAERMRAAGVSVSFLFLALQNHVFSYEPVLRWRDEWLPIHRRTPEPDHLARLQEPAPNPAARALVDELRRAVVDLFAEFGAASNQIGKTYPHLASMEAHGRALLTAIKRELDPAGMMNPGALGEFGGPEP